MSDNYYSAKIPIEITNNIDLLLEKCKLARNLFGKERPYSEFVKSAVRQKILLSFSIEVDHREIEDLDFDVRLTKTITLRRSLVTEIEETFYRVPNLRKQHSNSVAKFIRLATIDYIGFLLDICKFQM